MSDSADSTRPALTVIAGGDPTDEEVAALVAAFTVVTSRAKTDSEETTVSRWAARQRGLRRPLHPGPGAWRASAHPD